MGKKLLFVFLAIAMVVSMIAFAACGGEEEPTPTTPTTPTATTTPTTPTTPPEPDWEWPDKLLLGTAGVGDQGYVVGIAWSTPMAEATGMTIRVVVQPDMALRHKWLTTGEIDVCTLKQSGEPWIRTEAVYATREGGPSHLRGLYVSSKRDQGWVTRPDTGIKTPFDIKPGTKISYAAYLGDVGESQLGLIAWAQVAYDDIVWVPANSTMADARQLADGTVDIAFASNTVSSEWYEVEASPRGLAWMDVDAKAYPEAAARYKAVHPTVSFAPITQGMPSSIGHWGMTSVGPLLCTEDMDEDFAYNYAKWFDETHELIKNTHPAMLGITVENTVLVAENHFIPMHRGTVKYLKDKGIWTEKAEARRQYNIEVIDQYMAEYKNAIAEADQKGIEVNPENKEWVDLWYNIREPLPILTN
jgi:TRAP transporter TAXI family solute receptor